MQKARVTIKTLVSIIFLFKIMIDFMFIWLCSFAATFLLYAIYTNGIFPIIISHHSLIFIVLTSIVYALTIQAVVFYRSYDNKKRMKVIDIDDIEGINALEEIEKKKKNRIGLTVALFLFKSILDLMCFFLYGFSVSLLLYMFCYKINSPIVISYILFKLLILFTVMLSFVGQTVRIMMYFG
jgi:hypothetical protein